MLAELQAAIASLKVGSEIVKGVMAAGQALSEADLKLKLADLMGVLAESKVAVIDANDRLAERDKEIDRLREALRNKDVVAKHLDAYYAKNENGKPAGDPYCMHCFEVDHRLIHLIRPGRAETKATCPHCRNQYDRRNAPKLFPDGTEA